MDYTEGFKKALVQKLLVPGSKGITALSKEYGVPRRTLYDWRKKYNNGSTADVFEFKGPRYWPSSAKYEAILESAKLSEEELGRWLRENGLHSKHLEIWEKELGEMITSPKDKEEIKQLKKRNKVLEKELKRKEKALAEMAALLTLKKKTDALWGGEEE